MTHSVLMLAGSLGFGGAERQLVHHVRGLASSGHEVVVASMTRGDRWEPVLRADGIQIVNIDANAKPLRALAIARLARNLRPAIVQAAQAFMNLYAVAAGKASGARSIGALRNSPVVTATGIGRLGPLALRAPDLLVGNARCHVKEAIVRFGVASRAAAYLPNVVDPDQFPPIDRSSRDPSLVTVLFAGRLTDQKRPFVFVEAIRAAADLLQGSDVRLQARIVGDGPDRDRVATAIRAAGLAGICEMAGNQPGMADEYRRADLLALPSAWEGTPNVALEAMASALPIVVTPVGGVPDVMDDGQQGLCVPVDDVEATGLAISRLAEDPGLRMKLGRSGAARTARDHAPAAVIAELLRLHGELLRHGPCAG